MALKRIACLLMILILPVSAAAEDGISFNAKSVILTEASTGKTLFESNSHESLPPASVTKIMTMLLIMEAIDRGEISYDTVVTASERAKSMGGSTIFLDTNENMSVEDLLKGIAVASGNDGLRCHGGASLRKRGGICRKNERTRGTARNEGYAFR